MELKLISYPSIHLVGRQQVDYEQMDTFLASHGWEWQSDSDVPAEELVEAAGRLCYTSYNTPRPGGNKAYIDHILESGHGSVTEHAIWNFIVSGVSRSFSHELIRHRAGVSVSQLSQRYVDESVAEYVEPDIIANDPELHAVWLDAVKQTHAAYMKLADMLNQKLADPAYATAAMLPPNANRTTRRKVARQAARSVLPNATETMLFLTMNARAIRNIIEQRGSKHAEPEIRRFAGVLLDLMQKESPHLFGDYKNDGGEITTPWRKV